MRKNSFIYLFIFFSIIMINSSPVYTQGILVEDVDAEIEAEEYQKSGWYFGFGLGTGKGEIEGNSFSSGFNRIGGDNELDISQLITLNYGLGAIITGWAHLGFDGSAIRQQASYKIDGASKKVAFQIVNNLIAASFYPFGSSFFLKFAYGFCFFITDNDEDSNSYSGRSFLLGTGYDFRLGNNFRLGLHGDYSRQSYSTKEAPNDTNFYSIYLSFYWF